MAEAAFRPKQKAAWRRPEDGQKIIVVVLQVLDARVQIRTQRVDGLPVVLWVNMSELEKLA